jgi:hypothetical protein
MHIDESTTGCVASLQRIAEYGQGSFRFSANSRSAMQQKERSATPQVAEIRSPLLDGALASRNLIECLAISDPRLGDHAYKFNGHECLRAQRVPLPIACNGLCDLGNADFQASRGRMSQCRSTTQSSAASKPSLTTMRETSGCAGVFAVDVRRRNAVRLNMRRAGHQKEQYRFDSAQTAGCG